VTVTSGVRAVLVIGASGSATGSTLRDNHSIADRGSPEVLCWAFAAAAMKQIAAAIALVCVQRNRLGYLL
jgi:hypothetical protein